MIVLWCICKQFRSEELKQVLAESRIALNSFCQVTLGAPAASESLERPLLGHKTALDSSRFERVCCNEGMI